MSSEQGEWERRYLKRRPVVWAILFYVGSLASWALWLVALMLTGGGLSHPSDVLPGGPLPYFVLTSAFFGAGGILMLLGVYATLTCFREQRTRRP